MISYKTLLHCGAAVVVCVGAQAHAQARRFDIPAQPAITAIPEFAQQAQIQVIAPARDLAGVNTLAVSGEMDVRAALRQLISGTPLRIARDEGAIITLRSSARAPAGKPGGLSGRVLDPLTGQYMANAAIRVVTADGERRIDAAGERGEYRLIDLPSGAAEVTVSFTGFADRTLSVTIQPGKTVQLDFELARSGEPAAVQVSEVVVSGGFRDGDARAIMSQRNAMDIKNSLSSESFGSISEGNVGEFIKWMPGVDTEGEGDDTVRYVRLRGLPPEYTSITVNGVSLAAADGNAGSSTSRSFSFEQVSLSSIDAIEISKTVSADVDANAPAGTINLRTKRAFDRKGRRIVAQVSGVTHSDLWNDKITGPGDGRRDGKVLPNGQLEYSNVFFGRRLGVVASISHSKTYSEMEQAFYPRSYEPNDISPQPLATTTINAHMRAQNTTRTAASLTLDFKAADNLILSLATMYNTAYLWSGQRTEVFTTGARTYGVVGDPAVDFTTKRPDASIGVTAQSNMISKRGDGLTVVPSFEYQGRRFVLDGNLSYSDSNSRYDPLGKEGAIFSLVNSPSAGGNFTATRDGLGKQNWSIVQTSGDDWSNPASYTRQTAAIVINSQDGRAARTEMSGAALNLAVKAPFKFAPVTFKTGLKAKRAVYDYKNERVAHQYRYVGPLSVAQFMTENASPNELSFDGLDIRYASKSGSAKLYMPSNAKIGRLFLDHPEQFQNTITAANYYTAYIENTRHFEEDTNATYVMATSELNDRLTVRAGLRWEETKTRAREWNPLTADETRAAGFAVSPSTGRATTIDGVKYQYQSRPQIDRKGSYDYFFPSASLKFAINADTDLQVGYSRTIRRPEVNVLAGVWSINDEAMLVTAPNPGLKPEISDNLSIRVARYFEPVGLVSLNYFQNDVKGLFQSEDLTADEFGYTGGEYANYTFRTTRTVSGDSIKIRGMEAEFTHALDYLPSPLNGLTVRGSYTYLDPGEPIPLSAKHLTSLVLAYKKGPFSLNLNTLWTGRKLNSVSTGSYIAPRVDMFVSGAYAIRKGWQVFFSARNLLNEPTNIMLPGVQTSAGPVPDHAGDYRHYGKTATLGLRAVF
ncbi:TonB-dependent receptor [Caulobacter sp.]|uniref:TonB-dependent receptor n=1 Tax=Caulobacter sp. TaxID=78 RepID=UPI002B49A32A|nr:TonB-dependent receptor [Caulobacter sp.]HJV42279.1 TonB-dependent receptor [Caulobacter sp.]